MPPRKARQVSTPRSSSASSVTQSLTPDRPQRRYVRMDSPPENVDVWKVLRVPIMLGIFVFIISMLYFKIIPEYHEFLVSTTGLNITTGYFFVSIQISPIRFRIFFLDLFFKPHHAEISHKQVMSHLLVYDLDMSCVSKK
jgi:hypothetical protein